MHADPIMKILLSYFLALGLHIKVLDPDVMLPQDLRKLVDDSLLYKSYKKEVENGFIPMSWRKMQRVLESVAIAAVEDFKITSFDYTPIERLVLRVRGVNLFFILALDLKLIH